MSEFVIIFPTIGSLDIVKKTLPTVLNEAKSTGNKVIVRENTFKYKEKIEWLQSLEKQYNCMHLMVTSLMSVAVTLNICLEFAQNSYNPKYICWMEDDHGFKSGFINSMIKTMDKYYNKTNSNTGLRYGIFSGCVDHVSGLHLNTLSDGNYYPNLKNKTKWMGGSTACMTCSTIQHWVNVLKGYDVDEYTLSSVQTMSIRDRNYNRGYTYMLVNNGLCFSVDRYGRGATTKESIRRWDPKYTKSDKRSKYSPDE